jgi:2-phospho-L-lactate guanylyltransferase (CobY/MobA/RfbA family)
MAIQFIKKRIRKRPEYVIPYVVQKEVEPIVEPKEEVKEVEEEKPTKTKNNKKNRKEDMINRDQITAIEAAMEKMQPEVKVVKADRGLIERTESSKIIITEDNRQVLND